MRKTVQRAPGGEPGWRPAVREGLEEGWGREGTRRGLQGGLGREGHLGPSPGGGAGLGSRGTKPPGKVRGVTGRVGKRRQWVSSKARGPAGRLLAPVLEKDRRRALRQAEGTGRRA